MIGNLEYISLPIVYIYQLEKKKSHYYDKLIECASFIELALGEVCPRRA